MVTTSTRVSDGADFAASLPGRRYEHAFFLAMAVLLLATIFAGFAPSYYLSGIFRAPLPSMIIPVHGAVFSCWILLLIAQTSLVSAGRVDIHRRLGIAGFVLACVMFVIGLLAATDALVRGVGRDPLAFYMVSIVDMVVFPTLVFFAFQARFDPQAHKRIILMATIAITPAAIARLPFAFVHRKPPMAYLVSYVFLVLLLVYDLWSARKIHRATLWTGAFLVIRHEISMPIAKTAAWHAFASWVQSLAR